MPWETFDVASHHLPAATIGRTGRLTLNQHAAQLLGDTEAVVLLWDWERRLLGLRRAKREDPGSYNVARPGTSATINVRGFLRHHGYAGVTIKRRPVSMIDDVLAVPLDRYSEASPDA